MRKGSHRIIHWFISALFTAAWVALVVFCVRNRDQITLDGILSLSPGNSFLAVLMMLSLFALKSVTIVVWGAMLYVASAMLFTMPIALLVNLLGTLIMAALPYYIGTKLDAKKLLRRIEAHPRAASFASIRNQNGLSFSFLSRMIGLVPGDLLGAYCGAAAIPFHQYLLGSLLGMLPSMLTFTAMGTYVLDMRSPQFILSCALQAALSLLALVLGRRFRRRG